VSSLIEIESVPENVGRWFDLAETASESEVLIGMQTPMINVRVPNDKRPSAFGVVRMMTRDKVTQYRKRGFLKAQYGQVGV
jgi:hypothetical protein